MNYKSIDKIKVLNLYAGIGGNRKYWQNVNVTAVEIEPKIAEIYQDFFKDDEVVICDAHQYLLEHYQEYDFIWSSPPCPSHSRIRFNSAVKRGQNKPIYPDMKLYEEILFLKYYYDGKWVVENVLPYYEPLISACRLGNHLFWANFNISIIDVKNREHDSKINKLQERKGFNLSKFTNIGIDKKLLLRNCVEPELGLHIFNCAFDKFINIPQYYKQEVLI